jgi:predicted ArsR family transcriptional regulator
MPHADDEADGTSPPPGLPAGTGGRLLTLLCHGCRTVNELAHHLGLTDNAVRAQIAKLRRRGLVRQVGSRPGTRRPHADYELAPRARRLFPTAYEPVLRHLVNVLSDRLPPAQRDELLREVARRILESHLHRGRPHDPGTRLAALLRRIGGPGTGVDLSATDGRVVLRACGCPLASVTAAHPEICELLAGVLGDDLGIPVQQKCEHGPAPRCRFEFAPAE